MNIFIDFIKRFSFVAKFFLGSRKQLKGIRSDKYEKDIETTNVYGALKV